MAHTQLFIWSVLVFEDTRSQMINEVTGHQELVCMVSYTG